MIPPRSYWHTVTVLRYHQYRGSKYQISMVFDIWHYEASLLVIWLGGSHGGAKMGSLFPVLLDNPHLNFKSLVANDSCVWKGEPVKRFSVPLFTHRVFIYLFTFIVVDKIVAIYLMISSRYILVGLVIPRDVWWLDISFLKWYVSFRLHLGHIECWFAWRTNNMCCGFGFPYCLHIIEQNNTLKAMLYSSSICI